LAHRVGVEVTAAPVLSPPGAVVPHLAALDLGAHDAGALDGGGNDVDLVVFQMVSAALAAMIRSPS
jgi:hypothetical protein